MEADFDIRENRNFDIRENRNLQENNIYEF